MKVGEKGDASRYAIGTADALKVALNQKIDRSQKLKERIWDSDYRGF